MNDQRKALGYPWSKWSMREEVAWPNTSLHQTDDGAVWEEHGEHIRLVTEYHGREDAKLVREDLVAMLKALDKGQPNIFEATRHPYEDRSE